MRYEYKLLSYIHDTLRQECVNVGIIFYAEDVRYIEFGFRSDLKSMKAIFQDFKPDNLKRHLSNLRAIVDDFAAQYAKGLPFQRDIEEFLNDLVPNSAGSLVWGRKGSGISENLNDDFQRVFEKFVEQPVDKKAQRPSRPDEAVLRTFKAELKKRDMFELFQPKTIELAPGLSTELEYTYKNGSLHCLQPVSLDVGTEAGMRDKVLRIKGLYNSILESHSQERFRFYFLVGKPQDFALQNTFESVYQLLRQEKFSTVLTEDRAADLPDIINKNAQCM
jgi:hypothetical protein